MAMGTAKQITVFMPQRGEIGTLVAHVRDKNQSYLKVALWEELSAIKPSHLGPTIRSVDFELRYNYASMSWQALTSDENVFKLKEFTPNGRHRQTSPQTHSHPIAQSSPGTRGAGQKIDTYVPSYLTATGRQSGKSALVQVEMALMQQHAALLRQIEEERNAPKNLPTTLTLGELIAWRIWRLSPDGYLQSAYKNDIWRPGMIMSGKPEDRSSDGVPTGIYCFKTDGEHLRKAAEKYSKAERLYVHSVFEDKPISKPYPIVFGQISIWGTVIEHTDGYRAEFARVHSIKSIQGITIEEVPTKLTALRAAYQTKE